MIFSPIIHVELLTIGRRTRYFFSRVIYATALLVVMAFCYLAAFSPYRHHTATLQDQSEFAHSFFVAFSWIQVFVVLGLTPAMMAGTISVEHERKTIDYLLTTQLSDTEIALGKFAARLWSILMQLAVGVPILAIALTLGGVSPAQMFASFAVAFVLLCLTATLSLAISSRAARSREAITRTYLVIIALLTAPPLAYLLCQEMAQAKNYYPTIGAVAEWLVVPLGWLLDFHPFVFLTAVLSDQAGFLHGLTIGWFAVGYLGVSVLLAGWSVISVRRFYLRLAGKSAGVATRLGKWREKFRGKRKPVGNNAMIWKEITSLRSAINLGWSGRIAAGIIGFMILYGIGWGFYETAFDDSWRKSYSYNSYSNQERIPPIEYVAIVLVPMVFGMMLLLITSNAAGAITSEREKDTWITLMSTPVEGREVILGKITALVYGMRYWYALILLNWALVVPFRPMFLLLIPVLVVIHFIAAFFAAVLGLLCSLQASTSLKAMGLALAILVFGVVCVPMMAAGFTVALFRGEGEPAAFVFTFSLPVLFSAMHPMVAEMTTKQMWTWRSEEIAFAFGFFFSTLAYTAAGWFLYLQIDKMFDKFAGRSTVRSGGVRRSPARIDNDMLNRRAQGMPAAAVPVATAAGVVLLEAAAIDQLELLDEPETSAGSDVLELIEEPNDIGGAADGSAPESR